MKYNLDIQFFAEYGIMTGAKLEYCTLDSSGAIPSTPTWNKVVGLNSIPDIGSNPDTVEATTFDDLVYRSYVTGLQDLDTLEFGFNLETPGATANISVIYGLATASGDPGYGWKLTYASGITVMFISKCRYTFTGGAAGDLTQFNLNLTPQDGLTITVPTT